MQIHAPHRIQQDRSVQGLESVTEKAISSTLQIINRELLLSKDPKYTFLQAEIG